MSNFFKNIFHQFKNAINKRELFQNSIKKNTSNEEISKEELINYLVQKIKKYKNKSLNDISIEINTNLSECKNSRRILIEQIIKKDCIYSNIKEMMDNYLINIRTVLMDADNSIKEHISLMPILLDDMNIDNEFYASRFFKTLHKSTFIFVAFLDNDSNDKNDAILFDVIETKFNNKELLNLKQVFEHTQRLFNFGKILNEDSRATNFIKAKDNLTFHIRPKARDGDDTYTTFNEEIITRQGIWLNSSYLTDKLNSKNSFNEKTIDIPSEISQSINKIKNNMQNISSAESKRNLYLEKNKNKIIYNSYINDSLFESIVSRIENKNSIFWSNKEELLNLLKKFNILNLNTIYSNPIVSEKIIEWTINKIESLGGYVKSYEISNFVDTSIITISNYYKIIRNTYNKKLICTEDYFYIKREMIDEYLNHNFTLNDRKFILNVLNNLDLNVVYLNEKIDANIIIDLKNRIYSFSLWEDFFSEFFKVYDFSEEDTKKILNLNKNSYNYLVFKYGWGTKNIKEILHDKKLPKWIYKNALDYFSDINYQESNQKIFNNNIQSINDDISKIENKTSNIFENINIKKEINFTNISNYQLDLQSDNNDKIVNEINDVEGEQQTQLNVDREFEEFKYNVELNDWKLFNFLNNIDFFKWNNVEICVKYFLDNYKNFLKQEKLNDEKKLYDYLKNNMKNNFGSYVKFNKSPMIIIGDANREEQVLNLLKEYQPISKERFAKKYSKKYGVKEGTFLSGFTSLIFNYLNENDYYLIPNFELSEEKINELKTIFNAPYYSYDKLVSEINKIIGFEYDKKYSFHIVKLLGYRINGNLVYPIKYTTIEDFVFNIMKDKETIDFENDLTEIYENSACKSVLRTLQFNFQFIEFDYKKYINRNKLISIGITSKLLNDFVYEALKIAKYKFFTFHWLREEGFDHELFNSGFEDLFYVNVLQKHSSTKYIRINKRMLMKETDEDVTLTDFIEELFYDKDKIEIYDLISEVKEKYDIQLDKYKILEAIKGSKLYYCDIFETIFINLETYLEGIK